MLLKGSHLINLPIMGLHTGTKLAVTKKPIIDPANLKIIAYEVDGPMLSEKPSYLRIADVRELSNIGMIIDSADEFFGPEDVVIINKILSLHFNLIGLNVIDETKHKIGKVFDYSIDTNSFIIQQLNVKPNIIKSISKPELLIHRSQIIEINDYAIIVKSGLKKFDPIAKTNHLDYINPFRSISPEHINTNKS